MCPAARLALTQGHNLFTCLSNNRENLSCFVQVIQGIVDLLSHSATSFLKRTAPYKLVDYVALAYINYIILYQYVEYRS